MLNKVAKLFITLIGMMLGYGVVVVSKSFGLLDFVEGATQNLIMYIGVSLLFGIIFFIFSTRLIKFGKKGVSKVESELQEMPAFDIILGAVGLIFGLVIAYLLSRLFLEIPFAGVFISILSYLLLGYLGIIIPTKKRDDFTNLLDIFKRGSNKDKDKTKTSFKGCPKVLDTSVIIDGRIADICKTGFVEGPLVIPEFVLEELQHIADSSDSLKRNRGRRGLDILNKIQKELDIEVIIHEKNFEDISEVDSKLLKLAQFIKGKVVTNDFNLNKVAEFHGVAVLNINELANAVKPVVLPGEQMNVLVIKDGKESGQGVAYLDDGTMIVVDSGKKYIGENIEVMVTSVLQTAAGRMIFAKPKSMIDKAV
ncbi:PIN/TRAM domain-containing protein [Sporosalibacterium faouarense]|uniref:PIN/TRAM domain-containing protein n=1 Tax=Sporosalibacterium faouarense TaxID=516123 RepID=UPI00141CFE59|nr:PIN/TRAM domain-containing protein [Sporosalibacterium faouarense]MTI48367.1 PIN/TRAM domain-containing protein [Bacillota bacterium]